MQRSKGRSAVAYRSCTHLHDERVDLQHDYRAKTGHVSTELFGVKGIDLGTEDIGLLWNKAELSEKRKNSAVARELMVPLSSEWSDEQRRQCVRGLAEMLVARYGVYFARFVIPAPQRAATDGRDFKLSTNTARFLRVLFDGFLLENATVSRASVIAYL